MSEQKLIHVFSSDGQHQYQILAEKTDDGWVYYINKWSDDGILMESIVLEDGEAFESDEEDEEDDE